MESLDDPGYLGSEAHLTLVIPGIPGTDLCNCQRNKVTHLLRPVQYIVYSVCTVQTCNCQRNKVTHLLGPDTGRTLLRQSNAYCDKVIFKLKYIFFWLPKIQKGSIFSERCNLIFATNLWSDIKVSLSTVRMWLSLDLVRRLNTSLEELTNTNYCSQHTFVVLLVENGCMGLTGQLGRIKISNFAVLFHKIN